MTPDNVLPCLETFTNNSPGVPSSYSPTVKNPSRSDSTNRYVRLFRTRGNFRRTALFTIILSSVDCTDGFSSAPSFLAILSGWPTLQLSRYTATALSPIFHESIWSCSISSTVASSGRLTVLLIAPERKGCTADIILT